MSLLPIKDPNLPVGNLPSLTPVVDELDADRRPLRVLYDSVRGLEVSSANGDVSFLVDTVSGLVSVGSDLFVPGMIGVGILPTDYPVDIVGFNPVTLLQLRLGTHAGTEFSNISGISLRHHDGSELDIVGLVCGSSPFGNILFWGGGSDDLNQATQHSFCAGVTTTSFGTDIILTVKNSGLEIMGDTFWVGEGTGLVYGHVFTNNEPIDVSMALVDVWYELVGSTAWNVGQLNLCTFSDPRVTVLVAGRYEIAWSLSTNYSSTPGAKQQLEYGIMVDGVIQVEGAAHRTLSNTSDTGSACSSAIIDLPANSAISLASKNETSGGKTISVQHGNFTIKQIGGT